MIVAWPLIQAFVAKNWRVIGVVVGFLLVLGWHQLQVNKAWREGRAALIQEQADEAKRRNADAQAADAAARKCSADPACRLQNDGHRRD